MHWHFFCFLYVFIHRIFCLLFGADNIHIIITLAGVRLLDLLERKILFFAELVDRQTHA